MYILLYNHYKITTLFVRYQKNLSESSDGNYSIGNRKTIFVYLLSSYRKICMIVPKCNKLFHIAHDVCPYSKATRGNFEITLNVL